MFNSLLLISLHFNCVSICISLLNSVFLLFHIPNGQSENIRQDNVEKIVKERKDSKSYMMFYMLMVQF